MSKNKNPETDCVMEQESRNSNLDVRLENFATKRNPQSSTESATSAKRLRETPEDLKPGTLQNESNNNEQDSQLEEGIMQVEDQVTQLSDSIFIYTNRRLCTHGNVFEGEIKSGVYGIRSCAIKFAQRSEQNTKEAKILAKLGSHTHVISIIQSGFHRDMFEEHVYIALEKCHKQNLSQYFEDRKESGLVYDVNIGLEYSKQIIAGMTYVHENLIFHKDLKPSNILLSHDRSTIKLADFGLSEEIKSTSSKVFCKHPFGTNGFRPIESFGNAWASLKSDIFSLGVVLYFVLSNGKSPFGDDFHLWIYNMKYGVPDISRLLIPNPKATEHLIQLTLSQERCRRPSIWQVANHPCWTGKIYECNFDYGYKEETDDSDMKIPEQKDDDSEELGTEIEKTREFLRQLARNGYARFLRAENSLIIFDRKSNRLQRFNPRNQSVTKMHKFDSKGDWNFFTPVLLGDYIYVLTDKRRVYRLKFRDEAATWERRADLIHSHGPPVVVGSKTIFVVGASFFACNKVVSKYSASLNRWERMKDKLLATRFSSIVASQKHIYSLGGFIPGLQTTNRVERLDIASQSWVEVASMTESRWGSAAVEYDGGKILVAGGGIYSRLNKSVEKYDPDVNQWTTLSPMMRGRLGPRFHCHLIDGKIYAVGEGHQGIEKYDFEKDSWDLIEVPGEKITIYGSVLVKMAK